MKRSEIWKSNLKFVFKNSLYNTSLHIFMLFAVYCMWYICSFDMRRMQPWNYKYSNMNMVMPSKWHKLVTSMFELTYYSFK